MRWSMIRSVGCGHPIPGNGRAAGSSRATAGSAKLGGSACHRLLRAPPRAYSVGMARLSVNLNKIALLRNSRRTGVPDIGDFARLAHDAGADGLTVHPRPDERHIRGADIPTLAQIMRPWRPACELNIEGYPDQRLIEIARAVRP